MFVCVAKDKKYWFFGKFCGPTKWIISYSSPENVRKTKILEIEKELGIKKWNAGLK